MMFPNAAQLISNLKQNFANESEVMAAFNSWDSDKDGQISFAELKAAVQRSGQRLSDEDINAIFVVGDVDIVDVLVDELVVDGVDVEA